MDRIRLAKFHNFKYSRGRDQAKTRTRDLNTEKYFARNGIERETGGEIGKRRFPVNQGT